MGLFSRKKNQNDVSSDKLLLINEKTAFSVREAYKSLRTNLIFSMPEVGCKKILITSTTKNEGKSTVSVNLCKTLAENDYKVLLLDCDLRLSYLAKALNVHREKGLSDVIIGSINLNQGVLRLMEKFDFLPSGTVPPNPSELLGSDRMAEIVKALEKHYDYIIFDAPPIGIVADPLVLSPLVNGFLMVVRRNIAKKDDVDRCIREMQISGTKMLGFVLSAADQSSGRNGRYKSEYKSAYEHRVKPVKKR